MTEDFKYPTERLDFQELEKSEMENRAVDFYQLMNKRRSVRYFSDRPVAKDLIEKAILTASTAPSGAHKQPWHFVAISDPVVKKEIRIRAEIEEKESYEGRMSEEWLEDLRPIGTDWQKPFLETVPWIVICFAKPFVLDESGKRAKNYYVSESCGIACGMFISAIHNMGLATLTHTPSPMKFLNSIVGRPSHERPYILFPIGYPSKDATVPVLERKPLSEVSQWNLSEE